MRYYSSPRLAERCLKSGFVLLSVLLWSRVKRKEKIQVGVLNDVTQLLDI